MTDPNKAPLVPRDLMKQAAESPPKMAQELNCGDVFFFRDRLFVCLSNVTDERHTVTTIISVAQEDSTPPLRNITAIQLFRSFCVPVVHHIPITIQLMKNTDEEITDVELNALVKIREGKSNDS